MLHTISHSTESRRRFFDDLADRWDTFTNAEETARQLSDYLDRLAPAPDETVLDLGCGTGNLTLCLQALLPRGSVIAVDISHRMIEQARAKCPGTNISWLVADAVSLPIPTGAVDRVLCYSAWPHFADPDAASIELLRVLRPGRPLHIFHTISRERVNGVHAGAGGPIGHDFLPPAHELGRLLERNGFTLVSFSDTAESYSITATAGASRA